MAFADDESGRDRTDEICKNDNNNRFNHDFPLEKIFFGVILMLASAVVIVNAFNSNLKERKKQIDF